MRASPNPEKLAQSAEIARQTEEFKANGSAVQRLPSGEMSPATRAYNNVKIENVEKQRARGAKRGGQARKAKARS